MDRSIYTTNNTNRINDISMDMNNHKITIEVYTDDQQAAYEILRRFEELRKKLDAYLMPLGTTHSVTVSQDE